MPIVTVTEELDASAEAVWGLICDVENYPNLMPPVRSLVVLDERRLDGTTVEATTAWQVELKGSLLKWTERELRDEQALRLSYEQIAGDMERFDGWWAVYPREHGRSTAELVVSFEIGIPMLREMLDPVAVRAIRDNASHMLRSLVPAEVA